MPSHAEIERVFQARQRMLWGLCYRLTGVAAAEGQEGVEAGYERMESVSYAFLLALELLAPKARAVLILRDVLDYSASEVAVLLESTEANVRVIHHRARRRLEAVQVDPRPMREVAAATLLALEAFVDCLRALLTESVRTVTDANGEYTALRLPLGGRVASLVSISRRHGGDCRSPIPRFVG